MKYANAVSVKRGLAAALLQQAGLAALAVASAVLYGWVLSVVWGWFMTDLGLPPLSVAQALGIAIMVRSVTNQHQNGRDERTATDVCVQSILGPMAFLCLGWAVKQFA
jgi:predicted ABC-type sugar transport system permease subunit